MGRREIASHRKPDEEERGQGRGGSLHEGHDELVLDGRSGEDPARICPVVMPGNCTSPTVIMPFTVGIITARSAVRAIGCIASRPETPSARRASTSYVDS